MSEQQISIWSGASQATEARATAVSGQPLSSEALASWFPRNRAGVSVDEDNARTYAAWYAGCRLYAESVGSLPIEVSRPSPEGGRTVEVGHPLHRLLNLQPNPEMSAVSFRECLQFHAVNSGNAYAEIERTNGGDPVALWPIPPRFIKPERGPDGQLAYRLDFGDGKARFIDRSLVLHIHGVGSDGSAGFSAVGLAKGALSLGMAMDRHGEDYYANDATPGGILTHPMALDDDTARKNILKSWEDRTQGIGKKRRIQLLEEGMTYTKIGDDPQTSQLIEGRGFQVVEVARYLNLSPHLLKDLSRATFSNIEHLGLEFRVYSLRPWLVRWNQELMVKLLSEAEIRGGLTIEHNDDPLAVMDLLTRYRAYQIAINTGWLCVDDVRELENYSPVPDGTGKKFFRPTNLQPLDQETTTTNPTGVQ